MQILAFAPRRRETPRLAVWPVSRRLIGLAMQSWSRRFT